MDCLGIIITGIVIVIITVSIIIGIIISFFIIVYSPLNKHLPGKSSDLVQKELIQLALKSDSLASALSISSLYLSNIESIVKGDSISFEYLDVALIKLTIVRLIFLNRKKIHYCA